MAWPLDEARHFVAPICPRPCPPALELTSRIEDVELVGEPERVASNLVPGFRHMPIRYRIRPAADA